MDLVLFLYLMFETRHWKNDARYRAIVKEAVIETSGNRSPFTLGSGTVYTHQQRNFAGSGHSEKRLIGALSVLEEAVSLFPHRPGARYLKARALWELGDRDASREEIKRAYRKRARECHPDVNRDDPDCERRFKELTFAYEVLSDDSKRQEYDRLGLDEDGYEILGVTLPYVEMPVGPGRNLSVLTEVAARNHLLKLKGYHPARELARQLGRKLQPYAGDDPIAPQAVEPGDGER